MINQSIFQDESFKIDMMNKSGRFNPAMQGMSERSGESAKHFKGKVFEGSMLQKVPSERLYEYNKQKQEAWLSLAILIYGGHDEKSRIANLEKSFMYKDKSITLNKISKAKEENGKLVELEVENDVYSISREDITIASTKNNEYYNQMKKAEIEESLAKLPMDPQFGVLRIMLTEELIELNETMNADQKEIMNDMLNLSKRVAMKQLQYTEAQLDSGIQEFLMAGTGMTNAQPLDQKGVSPVAKQSEGSLNGPSQRA
jgi:hypothetical protein